MLDPMDWFVEFFCRHMERHPAYPWPDLDSPAFVTMAQSLAEHFRAKRVTEKMAERASKALMLVPHHSYAHIAEFFKCLPDPEVEYVKVDPALEEHYRRGDELARQRRSADAEAKQARREASEANRARSLAQIRELMAGNTPARPVEGGSDGE